MKTLWITGNYYPQVGGLQVYIDKVTDSLAQYAEVALLTESNQNASANQHICHFKAPCLTRPTTLEQWQEAADAVADAIDAFEPDIVHFSNANVAVYRPIIPAGIRTLATVHGNDLTAPWQWTPQHNVRERIVDGLNACDHIFAVSNHSAELATRWGVRTACTVITSGCDTDFFQPVRKGAAAVRKKYGIPQGVPIVLTVARLVPRKGHPNILEALERLPFPVYWLVVGDGPMREALLNSVDESKIRHQVVLAGVVSNEELLNIYNACDVFVLTPEEHEFKGRLDSEGFGLVFHEASACRKPVIGSAISGCQEAVIDGITGILVPPEDPQALADALEQVLMEPGTAQTLGRGGLAMVRLLGGWSRVAQEMFHAYEQVASGLSVSLARQR
jgi:glycosyltransferase involved in cell wall biosynthesis